MASRGGINLLDYGCIRIFPAKFVGGVVDLYHGLLKGDEALVVHAYETWGFRRLNRDLIETLNIWARFIYGPLLDDRVRTIADGVKPSEYGRREAFRVHQALRQKGRSPYRASSCSWIAPRSALAGCSCILAPNSTSIGCSTRPSRTSHWRRVTARQRRRTRAGRALALDCGASVALRAHLR